MKKVIKYAAVATLVVALAVAADDAFAQFGSGGSPFDEAQDKMQTMVDFVVGPVAKIFALLGLVWQCYRFLTNQFNLTQALWVFAGCIFLGMLGTIVDWMGIGGQSISLGF